MQGTEQSHVYTLLAKTGAACALIPELVTGRCVPSVIWRSFSFAALVQPCHFGSPTAWPWTQTSAGVTGSHGRGQPESYPQAGDPLP